MFHEFGHALHGLLSDTYYVSTSGQQFPGPSSSCRAAADRARGEAVGVEDLRPRLRHTEFVASALLDQAWHQISAEEVPSSSAIGEFKQKALKDLGVYHELVPPRYRTAYFKHTFSGGYDAGYYSYMWAEVLVADIEQWFASEGARRERWRAQPRGRREAAPRAAVTGFIEGFDGVLHLCARKGAEGGGALETQGTLKRSVDRASERFWYSH